MVATSLVILCLCYALIFMVFIVSLWISQHCNSPRLFRLISIVSSVSTALIPVYLKQQSSLFIPSTQTIFFASGLSTLFTLKFFELAFAYQWTYIRQIPLKLAVIYIIALPQIVEPELPRQTIRQESILSVMRGVCQFAVFQILLYLTPSPWLILPSSLLPLFSRYIRYGLFSILLYLSIDCLTGIGFGIYSYVFHVHMKRVFPAFPFVSTSLREFWSHRWNKLIQSSLHLISFVAIPNLIDPVISLNRTAKGLLAFVLSGFVHEYMVWFVVGTWSGKYMIFFFIHGLLVLLEITIKWPAKTNTRKEKILGWIWTLAVALVTMPLFFDPLFETNTTSNVN